MLDAKDRFLQVKLDEESSYLTTFWSPCGTLRWLRMPFRINTAPEEYQRRQTEHVSDLPGIAVAIQWRRHVKPMIIIYVGH